MKIREKLKSFKIITEKEIILLLMKRTYETQIEELKEKVIKMEKELDDFLDCDSNKIKIKEIKTGWRGYKHYLWNHKLKKGALWIK